VPDVYEYFQRACRREPQQFRGVWGKTCTDGEYHAEFWIEAKGADVGSIGYRCTTCCTLVGLCEHLTDLLGGRPLAEAAAFEAADLLERHPEIPASHRGRAALAADAVRSAARAATMELCL
jgi:hypothetical protein